MVPLRCIEHQCYALRSSPKVCYKVYKKQVSNMQGGLALSEGIELQRVVRKVVRKWASNAPGTSFLLRS